jgi:hypothetical protein
MDIERDIAKLVNDYLKTVNKPDYSPEWGSVLYELNRLRSAERYATQPGDLDEEMKYELYKLMTTKHWQLRPWYANSGRAKACGRLVKGGYLIPIKERDNPEFNPRYFNLNDNISYTITEKGLDWLLTLSPDDFQHQFMFPKPHDIRNWQTEINAFRESKTASK